MLNNEFNGFGNLPRSTRPMLLHPPQNALAPGVHQAEKQNEYEYSHFHQPKHSITLELCCPGEDEHCFNIEDDEQQREDVVANLALRPTFTDRINAAFVGEHLLARWLGWTKQR